MLSESQGMTGALTVHTSIPQSLEHSLKVIFLLRSRIQENRLRAQEEIISPNLHHHSNHVLGSA